MIESIVSTVSSEVSKSKLSAKKRRANQRNAQKSTGPITLLGKLMASRNSVTHAVFSAHVVLPGEHVPTFVYLRQCYINSLLPQDLLQLSLVDRIAADQWRMRRLDEAEHRLFELRAYEHREMLRQCREGELDVGDDERVAQRWMRIDDIIDPMTKESVRRLRQFHHYARPHDVCAYGRRDAHPRTLRSLSPAAARLHPAIPARTPRPAKRGGKESGRTFRSARTPKPTMNSMKNSNR